MPHPQPRFPKVLHMHFGNLGFFMPRPQAHFPNGYLPVSCCQQALGKKSGKHSTGPPSHAWHCPQKQAGCTTFYTACKKFNTRPCPAWSACPQRRNVSRKHTRAYSPYKASVQVPAKPQPRKRTSIPKKRTTSKNLHILSTAKCKSRKKPRKPVLKQILAIKKPVFAYKIIKSRQIF